MIATDTDCEYDPASGLTTNPKLEEQVSVDVQPQARTGFCGGLRRAKIRLRRECQWRI